jgi:hypothetical protein
MSLGAFEVRGDAAEAGGHFFVTKSQLVLELGSRKRRIVTFVGFKIGRASWRERV